MDVDRFEKLMAGKGWTLAPEPEVPETLSRAEALTVDVDDSVDDPDDSDF
jgi:hypothetical protein